VTPVNDAPVNRINGSADFSSPLSTDDNVDLPLNDANSARLSVTDVDDDGSATYTVILSVAGGTLLLGAADNPASTKQLTGTLANVNQTWPH
jgi:hypothetical protein